MSDKSDYTELQRQAINFLQGRERAPFGIIQSELNIGTEATEELLENLLHKGVIHTVEDPLSGFSNLPGTSQSEADIQALTFALDEEYER